MILAFFFSFMNVKKKGKRNKKANQKCSKTIKSQYNYISHNDEMFSGPSLSRL